MINENDTAKEAAGKVSNETNIQIMSNSVMSLRQCVEDRLKKDGNANSTFEKQIKLLYKLDNIKFSESSYKAYLYLEYDGGLVKYSLQISLYIIIIPTYFFLKNSLFFFINQYYFYFIFSRMK
jgi:hypothetical protein